MRIWLGFGLLLCLGLSARAAENCATVDNSADFGAVRDQGETGWCFGFAAADLLGERLGIKPPDMLSAFDLGTAYYTLEGATAEGAIQKLDLSHYTSYFGSPEEIRGALRAMANDLEKRNQGADAKMPLWMRSRGVLPVAVSLYSLRGGYCLESQLPSQDLRYGTRDGSIIQPELAGNPFSSYSDSRNFLFREILRMEQQARGRFALDPCGMPAGSMGPANTISSISESVIELAAREVAEIANERCSPRKPITPFVALGSTVTDPASREGSMLNLENHLRDHQSVGISYNGCDITESGRSRDPGSSDCSHASIVIGRKRSHETGECLYQIRNSWGPDCSIYTKDIQATCKEGVFWMGEKRLKAGLHAVSWID